MQQPSRGGHVFGMKGCVSDCKQVEKFLSSVEFILRPTVSRPVRLGIGLPFGAHDKIFILILSLVTIALLFFL
jgi:hypothetical protein